MRIIKNLILVATFTLCLAHSYSFTGKNSTEALLTFSYSLHLESEAKPKINDAREAINEQLLYLFGPMGKAKISAVPRGDHEVAITEVESEGLGLWKISYQFSGMIQVKKGPRTHYEVFLPRQISKRAIYDPGVDSQSGKNLCTDDTYNSFSDFWYFWTPAGRCPLKEGVHYDRIQGNIQRIQNSLRSYPEYPRLVESESGLVPISIFYGMDEEFRSTDPLRSGDLNAKAFRSMRKKLDRLGFESLGKLEASEYQQILEGRKFRRPYVETWERQTKKAYLRVRLFFGKTGIDEASGAFHYFFKDSTKNSSIIVFDGHSGLGDDLDLEAIQKLHGIKFETDPNRYQIFYFNSCTSYSYYNTVFFFRKSMNNIRKRTKSLDIMTNGLLTDFDLNQKTNGALVEALLSWGENEKIYSYQELAKLMDDDNLYAVHGDEDNPIYVKDVK